MNLFEEAIYKEVTYNTRRHFLRQCMSGLGALALGNLLDCSGNGSGAGLIGGNNYLPHYPAKVKHVIFMHMAGAPSQLELFDFKPELKRLDGQLCPPSIFEGKRFAFIKGHPKMLGPQANFQQRGQSGAWVSDFLPEFSQVADEVSFLKAVYTEEFNHAPAQFFMHTGNPRSGRPSIGSWVTYGLGSENENLPGFVVLISNGEPDAGKSVWGSGFIPTIYQGVQCRSKGEPILNLENPENVDGYLRQKSIDAINKINELEFQESGDPETLTRIKQYEMAFKMQTSVPEVMDIDSEPAYIKEMYGVEPGKVSFANNCLLARKLIEKGVRFVQLYDLGWDTHGAGPGNGVSDGLKRSCSYVDKPMAALITDLKQRGLFEETLLIWGGEFGRTPMMETRAGKNFLGRDHHNEAFTMWMAGGGIKKGYSHGETDELGFYGINGRVHVHDIQATLLHQLGLDHERLTYRFQGRDYRLTDVSGHIIREILA